MDKQIYDPSMDDKSLEELEDILDKVEGMEEVPFLEELHDTFLSINNLEDYKKGRGELRLFSMDNKEFRQKMKEENIPVYGSSVLKKGSTNVIYGNADAFSQAPCASLETLFAQFFMLYYKDIELYGEMDITYKRMPFLKKAQKGFKEWIEFQSALFAINTTNMAIDNEEYESRNRVETCKAALKEAEKIKGKDRVSSFLYVMAHLVFLENRLADDDSEMNIGIMDFKEEIKNHKEGVLLNSIYGHLLKSMNKPCNAYYFMKLYDMLQKLEKMNP